MNGVNQKKPKKNSRPATSYGFTSTHGVGGSVLGQNNKDEFPTDLYWVSNGLFKAVTDFVGLSEYNMQTVSSIQSGVLLTV